MNIQMRGVSGVLVLALILIGGSAFGQSVASDGTGAQAPARGQGARFVDEDGNGVCDRLEGTGQRMGGGKCRRGQNFVDADGDGVCDHKGAADQGPGFVDEDGNGICDRLEGTAPQMGSRKGRRGQGFVDADGDGVCDHKSAAGQSPGFVDEDGDGVCDRAAQHPRKHARAKGMRGSGVAAPDQQ